MPTKMGIDALSRSATDLRAERSPAYQQTTLHLGEVATPSTRLTPKPTFNIVLPLVPSAQKDFADLYIIRTDGPGIDLKLKVLNLPGFRDIRTQNVLVPPGGRRFRTD